MIGGRTVEGGGDDLALHRALHVGDLFRAFVHQHHHQMHFGVVGGDRVGDVLQRDGLAGLRRGDDQATLALADRGHDVDQTAGELVRRGLLLQPLLRVQRGELGELRTVGRFFHAHAVDRVDRLQRHELLALVAALPLARRADRAMHGIALAQSVLLDLAHRHIHVVRPRQIAGGADERVGVQHVHDARDRHQILLRTLLLLAILGVLAVTSAHAALAAVIARGVVVPVAAVAVAAGELMVRALVLMLLVGQCGEDVVQLVIRFGRTLTVGGGMLLVALAAAATAHRLSGVIDLILVTVLTGFLLGAQIQLVEQGGGEFVGGLTLMGGATRPAFGRLRLLRRLRRLRGGLLGCRSRLGGGGLGRRGLLGRARTARLSILRRADRYTLRGLSPVTRGLQGGEQFRLTHRRRATKTHLLGELLELGQLQLFKILAIGHCWYLSLAVTASDITGCGW